jgi:hypothetical protein
MCCCARSVKTIKENFQTRIVSMDVSHIPSDHQTLTEINIFGFFVTSCWRTAIVASFVNAKSVNGR